MATLFFTVFSGAAEVASGDPIQEDSIAIGGSSAAGAGINGTGKKRRRVRLFADADCFATWGVNPVASSTDGRPLAAGVAEYFEIEAGHQIAVITRV